MTREAEEDDEPSAPSGEGDDDDDDIALRFTYNGAKIPTGTY